MALSKKKTATVKNEVKAEEPKEDPKPEPKVEAKAEEPAKPAPSEIDNLKRYVAFLEANYPFKIKTYKAWLKEQAS